MLTYEVRPLGDYTGTKLAHLAQRQVDADLAGGFDHVSPFLDSAVSVCGEGMLNCCFNGEYGPSGKGCISMAYEQHCLGWSKFTYQACDSTGARCIKEHGHLDDTTVFEWSPPLLPGRADRTGVGASRALRRRPQHRQPKRPPASAGWAALSGPPQRPQEEHRWRPIGSTR